MIGSIDVPAARRGTRDTDETLRAVIDPRVSRVRGAWQLTASVGQMFQDGLARHDAGSEDRHFIVLVVGFLLDLERDDVRARRICANLPLMTACRLRDCAADLARWPRRDKLIAHPVGDGGGQQEAAFRTVVVGGPGARPTSSAKSFQVHASGTSGIPKRLGLPRTRWESAASRPACWRGVEAAPTCAIGEQPVTVIGTLNMNGQRLTLVTSCQ